MFLGEYALTPPKECFIPKKYLANAPPKLQAMHYLIIVNQNYVNNLCYFCDVFLLGSRVSNENFALATKILRAPLNLYTLLHVRFTITISPNAPHS